MLKIVLSIEHIRRFAAAAALLLCSNCWAGEIRRSVPWDVEDATLRFRIDKDHNYAQVPDVYVSDLKATKGPSDLKKSKTKGQWAGTYHRVNGKVYKKGIAVSSATTVVYKNQKEYGRFVALAGVNDRPIQMRLSALRDRKSVV